MFLFNGYVFIKPTCFPSIVRFFFSWSQPWHFLCVHLFGTLVSDFFEHFKPTLYVNEKVFLCCVFSYDCTATKVVGSFSELNGAGEFPSN